MSEEVTYITGFDRDPQTFEDLVSFIRKEKTVEYEKKIYTPELHEELFQLLKRKVGDNLLFSFGRRPSGESYLLKPECLEETPFFGKVYSDGEHDAVATVSAENILRCNESGDVSYPRGILDPEQPSDEQLQKIARMLGGAFLMVGGIKLLSFTQQGYRFNVTTMLYDPKISKIVHASQIRQSTAREFLNMLFPINRKTCGKIGERLYFFLDELGELTMGSPTG